VVLEGIRAGKRDVYSRSADITLILEHNLLLEDADDDCMGLEIGGECSL